MKLIYNSTLPLAIICAILISLSTTEAQTPETDQNFYFIQGSTIFEWDIITRQPNPSVALQAQLVEFNSTLDVENERPEIWSIGFDSSKAFIYRIEITSQNEQNRIVSTRLVRTDVFTGNDDVIFEQSGLLSFSVSPSGEHIFVTYYEKQFGDSRLVPCILDIATRVCKSLGIFLGSNNNPLWLDKDQLAIRLDSHTIIVIDTANLEQRTLLLTSEWSITSFTQTPDRNHLLIAANPQNYPTPDASRFFIPIQFLMYDITANSLTDFQYDALNDSFTSVTAWSFSLDGRYLFYGNLIHSMVLVEFETGKVLGEFEDVTQTLWLNDHQLIFATGVESPSSIFEFDVQTGQTTTLIADATGMVLLN